MAGFQFNAGQHNAAVAFEALPKGWVQALIEESSMKPTRNEGTQIEIKFKILAPAFAANRIVYGRYNVVNQNPTTVQIAMEQLAGLSIAAGVPVWNDTQELHNRPFHLKLKVRKAEAGSDYEDSNEPNGYKSISDVVKLIEKPVAAAVAGVTGGMAAPSPFAAAPAAPTAFAPPPAAFAPPVATAPPAAFTPPPAAPVAAPVAAPAAFAPPQQPAAAVAPPVAVAAAPAGNPWETAAPQPWAQPAAAAPVAAVAPVAPPVVEAPPVAAAQPWANQVIDPAAAVAAAPQAQAAAAPAEPPHPAQAAVPPWQQAPTA